MRSLTSLPALTAFSLAGGLALLGWASVAGVGCPDCATRHLPDDVQETWQLVFSMKDLLLGGAAVGSVIGLVGRHRLLSALGLVVAVFALTLRHAW
ncbi:MAG: hypothetical protein MUC96_18925 [Myxococcaceae bacterium]|jgi:hypothetical protein|nr:hypothetical protein [Myxococcaceae bacterium]